MYFNLFDVLADSTGTVRSLAKLSSTAARVLLGEPPSPRRKAVAAGVLLLAATFTLASIALFTNHANVPLLVLGVILGVLLSYPIIAFLAPKIQSAVGSFVAGITAGNLGSKETYLRHGISYIANVISDYASQVATAIQPAGDHKVEYLARGIVYCVWAAILTSLVIIAFNLYFANSATSQVGSPIGDGGQRPPASKTP